MLFTVFLKGGHFGISSVANQAVVGPFPTVGSHVQLEIGGPGESPAADRAAVRLTRFVCFQVLLEGRRLLEGLPAGGALKIPLPRLEQLVRHKVRRGAEVLAALVAAIGPLPGVQADVQDEPRLLCEGLLALRALERPLARVHALVGLEVRGPAKVLATVLALERLLPGVDGLVPHQV